jgi:hypothetical protein
MGRWQKEESSKAIKEMLPDVRVFSRRIHDGTLRVLLATDSGDLHMMIDHDKGRMPTWDEVIDAKFTFCPIHKSMAVIIPSKEEWEEVDFNRITLREIHASVINL